MTWMARFHLYPVPDNHRVLKSVSIVSDHDFPAGANTYTFKAGVASTDGVDYYGTTLDGATIRMVANEPFDLIVDGDRALRKGEIVVLDITSRGLPADLAGTMVHAEIDNSLKDPANRIQDPDIRAAVDGVHDHIRSVRAGIKTISIALPRQIDDPRVSEAQHKETTDGEVIASATFVKSTVLGTITIAGSPARPTVVQVVASVTFEGTLGTDVLYIGISDDGGTTVYCPNGQYGRVAGRASVSTHYAATIAANVTYTLMLRQATGTPTVLNQAMSIQATEA